MPDILFYSFAGLMVFFSILVVMTPNLLHGAIALVASFFMTAGLYLLFQMEFVAIAQVMVYIGGIVIFMVITILLTTRLGELHNPPTPKQRLWGLFVAATLLVMLLSVLTGHNFMQKIRPPAMLAESGSLAAIGARLLKPTAGGFIVPFELVSVLLLIALIGAVVIARKEPKKNEDNTA